MVEPTNLNPRCLRSFENASDSLVVAGSSSKDLKWLILGSPLTNRQEYESKEPNSSWIFRKACALVTAALTLSRLRMMPGSRSSFSILEGVKSATFCTLKFANAFLYPFLLFKMVNQESPA